MDLDISENLDNSTDANVSNNFVFKAKGPHDTPRPWVCELCQFPFKFKGNLLEHMRFFHLKGKVPCNYCDKTFPTSNHLRKHMKDHAFQRNRCPHCGTKLDDINCTYKIHLNFCKRRPKVPLRNSEEFKLTAANGIPSKRQKTTINNNHIHSWQCIECNIQFMDKESFHRHECLSISTTPKSFNLDTTTITTTTTTTTTITDSGNIPSLDVILSVNSSNAESGNPISPESLSSVESGIQINTSNSSNDSSNTPKLDVILSINSTNGEINSSINSELDNSDKSNHINTSNCSKLACILSDNSKNSNIPIHLLSDFSENLPNINSDIPVNTTNLDESHTTRVASPNPNISLNTSQSSALADILIDNSKDSNLSTAVNSSNSSKLDTTKSDEAVTVTLSNVVTTNSSLITDTVSKNDSTKTNFSESSNHSLQEIKLCNSLNLNSSSVTKSLANSKCEENTSSNNLTNLCKEISVSNIVSSNSSKLDFGMFSEEISALNTNIPLPNISSNFSGLNILPSNLIPNQNNEMPNLPSTYSRFDIDTITHESSKVNNTVPLTDMTPNSSGYNPLITVNSVNSNWESLGLSMSNSLSSNPSRFMSSSTDSSNSNILLNGLPNCSRIFDPSNAVSSNLNVANPGTNTIFNSSRFDNRSNDFSNSFIPTTGMAQPSLSLSPKSSSLLALTNFCNQKQLNSKDSVYASHLRTFTRSIDSIPHNKEILSRTTNLCIPPISPRNNSSIPNIYNNELNFAPPVFNSYMFPSSGMRMAPPMNFPQNVPNFFNPMLNTLRPPAQCFPYSRSSMENISYNPINAPFIPRLHPYQLNKINSANIHCMECQYPFCLSQLKSREIPYRCPYCSMIYKKIECLNNHVSTVHVTKTYQGINPPNMFNRNYNMLCCEYCKNNFCDQKSLFAHVQQCPLKRYDNLEVKSTWVCNNCNKYFHSKLLLLDHSVSCKMQVVQMKSQTYIEKSQSISLESERQENNERQNSSLNISQENVVSPLENNLSKSENLNCLTCGHIVYGKGKLCIFCWLKFALSQDFKKLMNSKILLPFSSKSILYKPISSETFQTKIRLSTDVIYCDKLKLKCYFCANQFCNIPTFESHLSECCKNRNSQNISIICCYCLNIFTEVLSYQDHVKNCKNYINNLSVESDLDSQTKQSTKIEIDSLQQSLPDKKIWECNKCNKVFTAIPLFTAHLPLCKSDKLSDLKNKAKFHNILDEQLIKYPAKVYTKTMPLSKCFEKKVSSVKLYCSQCGFCFDSKQKLKFHPCKQILKHMTSCSVHLEPLTGSKIMLMAQLLCKNGHSKRLISQKKHCLSYRQRYNEIFSTSKAQTTAADNLQRNCEKHKLSRSNANKKKIIDNENLLLSVFSDYEKKFHKLTQFHTTIYSHKFVCLCGQIRPYLQASIHMKIHRYSKSHQMKFLKPLWPSEFKKYNKLTSFSCKNCKNVFQSVEFFAGHLTFSYACRTFYRRMVQHRKKLKKSTQNKAVKKSNNLNSCHNYFAETRTSKSSEQKGENTTDKSNTECYKVLKMTSVIEKECTLSESLPSLSSIEFADKIANCIKEMSSRNIAQEMQRKQESLKNNLDSKNKMVKLSNCDGWMVEFDSATGDWRSNTVLKYICATCYKSLHYKTNLIDHLKKEHNIHGVIKLSVIKKQKSTDNVSNECKENNKDCFVNIESTERSSWSPIITNTFSLSLSSFECQILNNGKKDVIDSGIIKLELDKSSLIIPDSITYEQKGENMTDKSNTEFYKLLKTTNAIEKEYTLNESLPSLSSIEFADKIANCIREMFSRNVAQEIQRKQESLKNNIESKLFFNDSYFLCISCAIFLEYVAICMSTNGKAKI